MIVSKITPLPLLAAVLATFAAAAAPHGEPVAYTADSSLPGVTGQASAPILLPAPQDRPNGTNPAAISTGFTFTITGQDMDTWRNLADNSVTQFADARLVCVKSSEQFPTSGPHLRGTVDNIATWDLAASTDFADRDVPKGETRYKPSEMYVNTYLVGNTKGRNDNKQDDAPVYCQQVIIYAGHAVRGWEIPRPTFDVKTSVYPTKAQIARYDDTGLLAPDFIRKRMGPSEDLRRDMEKRLTRKQKADLQNGEYVAFTLGSLPPDLQEEAWRYIRVCEAINHTPASAEAVRNAPKSPRWQEYQIRFLPPSAGINYQMLGIVTVDKYGDKVYF